MPAWIMKRKLKQFQQYQQANNLKTIEKKKSMTYGIGNPGPGLGQAHKCGGVKPVNRS
jgi:hypothetical protein